MRFIMLVITLAGCECRRTEESPPPPPHTDLVDTYEGDEAGECDDRADNDQDGYFDITCLADPSVTINCQELVVSDGGKLKQFVILFLGAAYLCGNWFFAEQIGEALWPICEYYIANYPLETLWS